MTMDQMKYSNIEVPAGIISLGYKESGAPDKVQEVVDQIKIITQTSLKYIFEKFIEIKYGTHQAYEVWEPKIALSLCGEQFENVICDLQTTPLAQQFWQHQIQTSGYTSFDDMPYWQIVGPCELQSPIEENCSQSIEICNGKDDDCDYLIDEDNVCEEINNDCSLTNDCNEPNCIFYDDFNEDSLDTECKWSTSSGYDNFEVSNGTIKLKEEVADIETGFIYSNTNNESYFQDNCQGNFSLEIRSRLSSNENYFLIDLGPYNPELIHPKNQSNLEKKLFFSCFYDNYTIDSPFNLTDWNNIKIIKQDDEVKVNLNNTIVGTYTCPQGSIKFINIGCSTKEYCELDYVKLICD